MWNYKILLCQSTKSFFLGEGGAKEGKAGVKEGEVGAKEGEAGVKEGEEGAKDMSFILIRMIASNFSILSFRSRISYSASPISSFFNSTDAEFESHLLASFTACVSQ